MTHYAWSFPGHDGAACDDRQGQSSRAGHVFVVSGWQLMVVSSRAPTATLVTAVIRPVAIPSVFHSWSPCCRPRPERRSLRRMSHRVHLATGDRLLAVAHVGLSCDDVVQCTQLAMRGATFSWRRL